MINHLLKDCSLDCFTKVKLAMNKQPDGCWEVQIAKEMVKIFSMFFFRKNIFTFKKLAF